MKKLLYLLVLIIPLSAQEVKEEVENKEPEQCCVEKETTTQKVVRHLQDAEWRKFQAAHRRAHSKRGEHAGREFKKHKRGRVSKAVGVLVIGGIGYYIGLNEGKKHWHKRMEYKGDRP
jgi:hypothetical protein